MTRPSAISASGDDIDSRHEIPGRWAAARYLARFHVGDAGALQVLRFTIFALLILVPLNVFYYELDRGEGFSDRVILFALPVAVSQLYHGKDHDYTAYAEVARQAFYYRYTVYQKPFAVPLDILTEKLREVDVKYPDQLFFWGYDDRGYADFISISFYLFGQKYTSLIIFYILIIILSSTLFFAHYYNNKDGLFVLVLTLIAYNTSIVGFLFHQTPVNIVHERAFDLLSLIAIIHIGYFILTSRAIKFRDILLLGMQSLIFIFVYHSRSSNAWQVGVLLLLSGGVVFVLLVQRLFGSNEAVMADKWRGSLRAVLVPTVPSLILIGTLVLLAAYTRATYNPQYFAEQGSRTVWHNALMGLAKTTKGRALGLIFNDNVIRRVVRQNEADRLGVDFEDLNWDVQFGADYEKAARRLYLRIVREAPWEVLKIYLFTKPVGSLSYIWQASYWGLGGNTSLKVNISGNMLPLSDEFVSKKAKDMGFYYDPFPLWIVIVLSIVTFIARPTLRSCLRTTILATLILIFGLVPSAIFYNQDLRQLTHVLAAISFLSYALVTTALVVLITGAARFMRFRPGGHAIHTPAGSAPLAVAAPNATTPNTGGPAS